MAPREHSRFVHFVLPWLIAAAGVAVYTVTLNRWVALAGLDVVSKVAGWDRNTMQLGLVTLLLTWPIRWLPGASQPVALNFPAPSSRASPSGSSRNRWPSCPTTERGNSGSGNETPSAS